MCASMTSRGCTAATDGSLRWSDARKKGFARVRELPWRVSSTDGLVLLAVRPGAPIAVATSTLLPELAEGALEGPIFGPLRQASAVFSGVLIIVKHHVLVLDVGKVTIVSFSAATLQPELADLVPTQLARRRAEVLGGGCSDVLLAVGPGAIVAFPTGAFLPELAQSFLEARHRGERCNKGYAVPEPILP